MEATSKSSRFVVYSSHASYMHRHSDLNAAPHPATDAPGEITARRHQLQVIPRLTHETPHLARSPVLFFPQYITPHLPDAPVLCLELYPHIPGAICFRDHPSSHSLPTSFTVCPFKKTSKSHKKPPGGAF